jgi:hypothetical protein
MLKNVREDYKRINPIMLDGREEQIETELNQSQQDIKIKDS